MPFDPANRKLELRVIPPNRFELLETFAYTDPRNRQHVITPQGVGNTDLASVPWFLWWFVASYGRHTAAALVHDQLVETIDRRDADWIFRSALEESDTSWIRRWLMWAAVSFETRFRTAFKGKAPTNQYPNRREQRKGRWVTPVGFSFVFGHLAVGFALVGGWWKWEIWFLDNSWRGHALSEWLGVALVLAWFAVWRVRGTLLLVGFLLLGPAIIGVLLTAFVVWGVLELGFVRLLFWPFYLLLGGSGFPGGGGIGPTMRPQKAPLTDQGP